VKITLTDAIVVFTIWGVVVLASCVGLAEVTSNKIRTFPGYTNGHARLEGYILDNLTPVNKGGSFLAFDPRLSPYISLTKASRGDMLANERVLSKIKAGFGNDMTVYIDKSSRSGGGRELYYVLLNSVHGAGVNNESKVNLAIKKLREHDQKKGVYYMFIGSLIEVI